MLLYPKTSLNWWALRGNAPCWEKHVIIRGEKKVHGGLFPVMFLITRVKVNTDGGKQETSFKLNIQLAVAPAVTDGQPVLGGTSCRALS